MKLNSNRNKRRNTIIICIIAMVLVLGISLTVTIVSNSIKKHQNTLTGIMVSSNPSKTVYKVGEEFDHSGLVLQVLANSNEASYFVYDTDPEIKCSGFDSSVANEKLVITVTYKEFTTSFTVTVKEPEKLPSEPTKTLVSVRLSDNFKTEYTLRKWNTSGPNFNEVNLICTFSDGSEEIIPMTSNYCDPVNLRIDSPCTYDLVLRYSYAGTEVTVTVPITLTKD